MFPPPRFRSPASTSNLAPLIAGLIVGCADNAQNQSAEATDNTASSGGNGETATTSGDGVAGSSSSTTNSSGGYQATTSEPQGGSTSTSGTTDSGGSTSTGGTTDSGGSTSTGGTTDSGGSTSLTVPTVGQTPIPSQSTVRFVGVASGKCIGVTGASSDNNATLELQGCDSSATQLWTLTLDASGYYTLTNSGSGKCLDVTGFSTESGTVLQQYNCSGGDNQKWIIADTGDGNLAVVSKLSNLAISVLGESTSDGTAIVQATWWNLASQLWTSETPASSGPSGFGAGTTGGDGGTVVTVTTPDEFSAALCDTESSGSCTDTTPRIIQVSGIIDFRETEGTTTETGCTYSNNDCSVDGKSERILDWSTYCSGRTTYDITYDTAGKSPLLVGSNKTLIGVGATAGIKGKGLILKSGVSNIIIRNLSITDINEGIIWAGDAITIDNASQIWLDHNYLARVGRQMIVTGWGTAQNVTISDNYFDGTTDYGHYCDGRHYWVMLLVGENQTITLSGNRIHNTSGRSPEVGKQSSATSGGIIHIANNYYDSNYYMGLAPSDDSTTLVEGNYFSEATYFFPIYSTSNTNLVYAPLDSNVSSTDSACNSALGRACVANYATSGTESFWLNSTVLSNISAETTSQTAVAGVVPTGYSSVPSRAFGPQESLAE